MISSRLHAAAEAYHHSLAKKNESEVIDATWVSTWPIHVSLSSTFRSKWRVHAIAVSILPSLVTYPYPAPPSQTPYSLDPGSPVSNSDMFGPHPMPYGNPYLWHSSHPHHQTMSAPNLLQSQAGLLSSSLKPTFMQMKNIAMWYGEGCSRARCSRPSSRISEQSLSLSHIFSRASFEIVILTHAKFSNQSFRVKFAAWSVTMCMRATSPGQSSLVPVP